MIHYVWFVTGVYCGWCVGVGTTYLVFSVSDKAKQWVFEKISPTTKQKGE